MRKLLSLLATGLLLAFIFGTTAHAAPADPNDVTVQGQFSLVHSDDFVTHASAVWNVLQTDQGRRYRVNLDGRPVPRTGSRVQIRGQVSGDTLSVPNDGTQRVTTQAQPVQTSAVSGNRKLAVILFNFTDNISQPFTTDTIRSLISPAPTR